MKRSPASFFIAGVLFFLPFLFPGIASAEEETFYCEVLAVEGTVYLTNSEVYGKTISEGDLLKGDDEIETAEGSTADLAFDKDWSNVTRVEEKTKLKIKSVFPTRLFVENGALYAKLKSLPKDSVFQVETPTAIAAVRGTEYRTEYRDGETSISNDSELDTSAVYVYEPHEEGLLSGEPTLLPRDQFTGVARGEKPRPPQQMTDNQRRVCRSARGVLDHRIQENRAKGRVSKIQNIQKMEAFSQRVKERGGHAGESFEKRREEREVFDGPNDNHPGGMGHGNERGSIGDNPHDGNPQDKPMRGNRPNSDAGPGERRRMGERGEHAQLKDNLNDRPGQQGGRKPARAAGHARPKNNR